MKSSANGGKGLHQAQNAVYTAVMAGILLIGQVVMSGLPNIEPVSLLIMVYMAVLGWRGLFPVYIYVLLEYLIWGVNLWSICYLYVWLVLALLAAGVVAAFFAFLIGLPVLRLKSDYLAIATLGFAEIVRGLVQLSQFGPLTNGPDPLNNFTAPDFPKPCCIRCRSGTGAFSHPSSQQASHG